ncbi:MAG: type II secretion system protein [bacterium]
MDRSRSLNGFSLVEILMVVAIIGVVTLILTKFTSQTSKTWHTTTSQLQIQQQARIALDEMTRYIRHSSAAAQGLSASYGMYPGISQQADNISFYTLKGKRVNYFQDGDTLKRCIGGSTRTLITEGLESIYFMHKSSYTLRIASMTVRKRDKSFTYNKTVTIRNQWE